MGNAKIFDITGHKFGKLTAIGLVGKDPVGRQKWLFKCDCGTDIVCIPGRVANGHRKGCRKCCNIKDLTGKRFGRLVAISRFDKVDTGYRWLCRCDCGEDKIYRATFLLQGKAKTCGCGRMLNMLKGESGLKELYYRYKNNADSAGRDFTISIDTFKTRTSSRCYYCGCEPSTKVGGNQSRRKHAEYLYNGLDRIDNSVGYVETNVVPCCDLCNKMKHTAIQEKFIEHVLKIAEHIKGKRSWHIALKQTS